jgi:uncharacterized protein (UPF0332 family)
MRQQPLTDEERALLVNYRLERAKETLAEADSLIKDGFYNAAINRLYYACFYAAVALLVKNGISAQTHNGVKQMFSLHFIANGKVDRKFSVFYGRLFNDRMSGDYEDFVSYDLDTVLSIRPQAEDFIGTMEKLTHDL